MKLEVLRNKIYLEGDDAGGGTKVVDPPVEDKKESDPPKEEAIELVVDGELIKLTPDQAKRAMHLGVVKAKEQLAEKKRLEDEAAKNKDKIDKVEEKKPDETLKAYEARIARLESDQAAAQDDAMIARLDLLIDNGDVLEDFKEDVKTVILTRFVTLRQQNPRTNIGEIAKTVIEQHKKKTEKFRSTVDVEKKLEDKNKTKTQGGGKAGTSQEDLPKLGRNAFRNGDLSKRIQHRFKQALGE